MFKSNYSLSALTLIVAAVFFLSSCSTVSITQRKYNKGFHVEWAYSQNSNTKTVKSKENKKSIALNSFKTTELEQPSSLTLQAENIAVGGLTLPIVASKTNSKTTVAEVSNNNFFKAKTVSKTTTLNSSKKLSSGDSDLMYLLIIILAIIIPPIGVFLHEGSWTRNVTISLILSLVFGILGFGGFLGLGGIGRLLYLIAIIHALMIVL